MSSHTRSDVRLAVLSLCTIGLFMNSSGCPSANEECLMDVEAPTLICSDPPAIGAGPDGKALLPDLLNFEQPGVAPIDQHSPVNASDGCSIASLTQSPPAGTSISPPGATVQIVATDPAGHVSTCSVFQKVEPYCST